MKASISKLYEIIWLLLSIGLLVLASYEWYKNGFLAEAYKFYGLAFLSFLFYLVRKARHKNEGVD